jgi:O-antigen/teichoic acid export membrane protein
VRVRARRFARDTLGLASSQYLARAVLLGRGVLAARVLGPAGFGAWNALNLILDYGAYASCGVLQGLDLTLPTPTARGDAPAARRLMADAWSAVVGGGVLFALLVVVVRTSGHPVLLNGLGWDPPLLMLGAALLQLVIQYHGSALRARGRFGPVSGAAAAQAVLGGGLGISLLWRYGIRGLLWGWLAGTLVALALQRRAAADVPLRPGRPAGGLALARGGFVVFAFFAVSTVLRSVDRLALIRFGRPEDLGTYSVGLMAAGLVLYVPEAAAAVLYPRIVAAAGGARDLQRTREEVTRAHHALALLLAPLVAVGMVWVAPVLTWLLPQYVGAAAAIRLLALAGLWLSASTLPGYWLLGGGRGRALLLGGMACAAGTAALVFAVAAAVPHPAAVAAAECAGYAAFAALAVVLAARDLRRPRGSRAGFVVASFLPSTWAAGVALAACAVGPSGSLSAALLRTAVVGLAYAPLLAAWRRDLELGATFRAAPAEGASS